MTTVVIVDDHHHCLPDIHLAIRQHCLPFSHIHVIHVDAHPDLSFSANIDTNVIFDPEKLYDTLDESIAGIAEFLLPLVFAGHVNQITWLKPSWATQMPCGAFQKLKVGRRNLNGAMGVTCGLPHFVEDELYCSVEEMNPSSTKAWDLFVTEMKSSFDDGATVATNAISTARTNTEAFILDIDLDYFSTWNPFRKGLEMHIDHAAMKIVTQVFTSVRYKVTPLDSMQPKQRDFERREFGLWMNRLEAADKMENASKRTLEFNQVVDKLAQFYPQDVNAARILVDFIQVLEQYRGNQDARYDIWSAGSFLDLPHHESSLKEIEYMVNELEQFLRTHALASPAMVIIAKSTGDEFLPPHQENVVLSSVLRMLKKVIGELSIKVCGASDDLALL
ncbi:hypothetical protein Plhal304r1_c055g0140621 [Plasmopara halstedii]